MERTFSLSDLKQTRVYQEGLQEGLQEARQEGRLKAKLGAVPKLSIFGFNS